MKEAMARDEHSMPRIRSRSMMGSVLGIFESMRDLSKNPTQPKTEMGTTERIAFEDYLRALGICSIGYTKVPARWVFRGQGNFAQQRHRDRDGDGQGPNRHRTRPQSG